MSTTISILLLLVGAAGTWAAFGGATFNEDEKPLLKATTGRGWISIACAAVALVLGIAKETISANEENQKRIDQAVSSAQAKSVQDNFLSQMEPFGSSRNKARAGLSC